MKPATQEKISGEIGLLDLLNSPDLQREILLCLARYGPADAAVLTQSTGLDPTQVQEALAVLLEEGRVRPLANGQVEAVIGRAKGRTTLPAQLWQALLTTDRLYSGQDIATLRTAIPILQFARARMVEFADHGPGHALRVKSYASQLGHVVGLNPTEQGLLRAAALFHDVGNAVDRERHNMLSQETVIRLTADGELPFSAEEAEVVGLLCRWHRCEYDPNRADTLEGDMVRTGLLASILRVADAMDIDQRRSDYTDRFYRVLGFFFPQALPFWTSLKEILGVRVCCKPAVELQVLMVGRVTANLQIAMLREDLDSTPLGWVVREIAVDEAVAKRYPAPPRQEKDQALLVFPFEPHSLIMAALSREHLVAAGAEIELLCYPDTAGGPVWLWGQVLAEIDPGKYDRLVVIGDRPDDGATAHLLETARRWRAAGVEICLFNRYEANWHRLPALLELGVEAVLGGDWAYFWGEPASQPDMAWGRIAGLCTRDPNQSLVGLTDEEDAVTKGLLKVVYDAADQPAIDTDGWAALVRPILDRIQADDRLFFSEQAAGFAAAYATGVQSGRVEGRVLHFEAVPGRFLHSSYWALEAAIEHQGRALERGISFKAPYAIATWPEGEEVELLAINHWREEAATPIRLLYPGDLGSPPAGNECTIQVRLPAAQAEEIVRRLLDACNRREA
jgi:hypothetical protein